MARCFYCNVVMSWPNGRRGNVRYGNDRTLEHIYPRRGVVPPGLLHRSAQVNVPIRALRINQAYCCNDCNNTKGQMHPMEWLVYCPSEIGAERLARRLIEIGEKRADVAAALTRRAALLSGSTISVSIPLAE